MRAGIAVYSDATVCSQDEVRTWVAACSKQLEEHLCPAWSFLPVEVTYYPSAAAVPAGMPCIKITDVCPDPGALAYHTQETDGRITGIVGAKTTLDDGASIPSALSHELTETTVNAFVDQWVDVPKTQTKQAKEVADPVQDQEYEIDGVVVSNFVTPEYFDQRPPAGSKFDYLGRLTRHFSISSGGYRELDHGGGRITQEGRKARHRVRVPREHYA